MQQTRVDYNGQSFAELAHAAHGIDLYTFLQSRDWVQSMDGQTFVHDCGMPGCSGTLSATLVASGRDLCCSACHAASGEIVMVALYEPRVARANGHDTAAPVAPMLDPSAPLNIARAFRDDYGGPLRCQQGAFLCYDGVRYAPMEPDRLREALYDFLDTATKPRKDGPVPFKPTQRKVSEVYDALKSACFLGAEIASPSWIGLSTQPWPAGEIIACQNGLLHLPTLSLAPPTPSFFTTNALDFDYEPDAPEPGAWLSFLHSLWPDDDETIGTLQEVFGYLLAGGTNQQKIFLLVGPKRSGKGTIGGVLRHLLGVENVASPTLGSLGTNFGLQPLIGKRLAIIGDARLGGKGDQQVLAERLLSISGEDAINIPRKFLTDWNGRLAVRFVILTNQLPSMADVSGALPSRFVPLVLKRSFYGREDLTLAQRLLDELAGILRWSIDGWRRLSERGYFSLPNSSYEAISQLEDLASPITAFVRERCDVSPSRSVPVDDIYNEWQGWCRENGRDHTGTKQTFGRDLTTAFPEISTRRPRDDLGSRFRVYDGIGLN